MNKKLFKEDQKKLKGLLIREFGLRKSLGINRINEEFEMRNLVFRVESDRETKRTSTNYKQTYWVLKKVA